MQTGTIEPISIFSDNLDFETAALAVFNMQHAHNPVYRAYCDLLNCDPTKVLKTTDIPFLPIAFFKSKEIKTTTFNHEVVFESSRTTGAVPSCHFVKDVTLYQESYLRSFELFYGDVKDYCIIGLLPSYLERGNSSLVYMVADLIKRSGDADSDFYLHDLKKLHETIRRNESKQKRTLVIGVTFAILDFAREYPLPLRHTIIMETGGMKGRKREMTREEVHTELQLAFSTSVIHSEYGMTELLSQAYATNKGMFSCPPWMKMLVREADDPFNVQENGSGDQSINGLGNVIDLANIYSCSFIATDDVVKLHPGNTFEILGRADNSDVRGCSLMLV